MWIAALFAAWWCVGCLRLLLAIRGTRLLADEPAPAPAVWPRLSVVVAACNEARTLEAALATLLAQDYPELEILVVDDRSTDGTGEIVDRLAARDPRVRALHVRELPGGWLGKVHALHVGAGRATGELILFTDADVHLTPGTLRRAVAVCVADGLDHLAVLPDAHAGTLLEEVAVDAMGQIFLEKGAAGVGAFNLVRRAAFARTAGFDWLRMEVLDDVGLGLLMREAGARQRLDLGAGTVSLTWYASMRDMAGGLEKNLYAWLAGYRLSRLALVLAGWWAAIVAPIVALAARQWILAGVCALVYVTSATIVARRARRRLLPALLLPIGRAIVSVLLVRSARVCRQRGGVVWRGTTYPLAELRARQRVK